MDTENHMNEHFSSVDKKLSDKMIQLIAKYN